MRTLMNALLPSLHNSVNYRHEWRNNSVNARLPSVHNARLLSVHNGGKVLKDPRRLFIEFSRELEHMIGLLEK
jgi:hypothetical protein